MKGDLFLRYNQRQQAEYSFIWLGEGINGGVARCCRVVIPVFARYSIAPIPPNCSFTKKPAQAGFFVCRAGVKAGFSEPWLAQVLF